MGVRLVTSPDGYPLTLTELKNHLRVEHSEHDANLTRLIISETSYAEKFMGRRLVPQTWDAFFDAFPRECESQLLRLPLPKVISVTGVFYQDSEGAEQTWDDDLYVVDADSEPARIAIPASGTWPTTYNGLNAIRVRFETGYQDSSVSPPTAKVLEDIKTGLCLRIQALYDGGEQTELLMKVADGYFRHHRVHVSLG